MKDLHEEIPSDQFVVVMRELEKFVNQVDEIDHSIAVAKGIDQYEARRNLVLAREALEVAGFRLDKARTIAVKMGKHERAGR